MDNTLNFGHVPAGTTVSSSDTFTFRHDRLYAFSWSNLTWNISFELPANHPPVANAGQDQDVTVGSLVTLDGRNSYDPDGDLITYNWTIIMVPSGSIADLNNPTSVMPTFTADVQGEYRISLTVNDGQADSAPIEVVIIATLPNVAPTANAGPDQSVVTGSTVLLDGTGSFDPDGDPITYQWQILSGPEGSTASLDYPSSVTPTFIADEVGQYTILLTVNDGELDSLPDDVIVISAIPNALPVSYAGGDQIVSKNTTIQLDGRGSSDPNNDPLTYSWTIVSKPEGSTSELNDPASPTPQILADKAGDYVFTLIVFDGQLYSNPDTVVIKVVNDPPIAEAGPDHYGLVGIPIDLNGSASSDPNGDVLTYQWSIVSAPSGSTAVIVNPTSMTPSITPDLPGIYGIQLVVNDNSSDSAPDTVNLTVRVRVPNVVGQTQASAEAAIIAAGLTLGTITQEYSAVVPAGNVISQNPAGGTLALAGSSVSLTISLGPVMATVPNMVGQPQASAEAAIIAAGLTVGAIIQVDSITVPAGSVISQAPVSGTSVTADSPVYLVVSLGPAQVTVPNVVGISQTEAQTAITFSSLTVGAITTANSLEVARGNVISQTPSAGSSLPEGSSVSLIVSLGPPLTTVPDVLGFTQEAAQSAIVAAGLNVGAITSSYHDTIPAGNVISQNPAGGSSVAQGSSVDLLISLGPSGPPPSEDGVLLEGPPDASAMSALRNVNLISHVPPSEIGFDASGRKVARTELLLKLAPDATVGDVNAVLTRIGARITSMIEHVPYLLVRFPDPGTLVGLDAVVTELEASSVFEEVSRSYFPTTSALPPEFNPATLNQFDVIDHLLGINAPAAWNARAALQTAHLPVFLIADEFGAGAPYAPPFWITTRLEAYGTHSWITGHGYHVLGIASADFGDEFPTGLLPGQAGTPLLHVSALDISLGMTWNAIYNGLIHLLVGMLPDHRVVINTSLGFDCRTAVAAAATCNVNNARLEAVKWVSMVRAANFEGSFIHLTAAGNAVVAGDVDARTGSPFAAAALLPLTDALGNVVPNLTNTLVVENVVGRAVPPYDPQCLNNTSKIGGHVSAVGTDVDSYDQPSQHHKNMTGTSMATPQVAALATYVWALNPNLTPVQLKVVLLSTTRAVTPPNILPANCKAGTPALRINAYGAVLAADEPVALSAAGKPVYDAPARFAILDVADSNGVEGGDGAFDQGDLKVFLDKIPQGVGKMQSQCTGYDWSRYDLSGDGHTGADRGNSFNLDINKPAAWTYVTAPEDPDMTFNESCVTDMQVMCYYAYSPLYTDNTDSKTERDNFLHGFCGHGQKAWHQWVLPSVWTERNWGSRDSSHKLAADGRGNVFAAYTHEEGYRLPTPPDWYRSGIVIGKVSAGVITTMGVFPEALGDVVDFFVDKLGNMILVYLASEVLDGNDVERLMARRYNVDHGWEETPIVLETGYTHYFNTTIAADACGNAIVVWHTLYHFGAVRYDSLLGWESLTMFPEEDVHVAKISMGPRGNAILVWTSDEILNGVRPIWTRNYNVDSGWNVAAKMIASSHMTADFELNIVMDALGNAIVTSYTYSEVSGTGATQATHYNVKTGWQQSVIIADNDLGNLISAYAYADFSGVQTHMISMDECGNAMIVYQERTGGVTGPSSLMSKSYSIDKGWDEIGTVVEPVFNPCNLDDDSCSASNRQWLFAFAMHGGGNATLITGGVSGTRGTVTCPGNPPRTYPWYLMPYSTHIRKYQGGKGWGDTKSTIVLGEWIAPIEQSVSWSGLPFIDAYGNATRFGGWNEAVECGDGDSIYRAFMLRFE